jgi:hypothetical protein
MPKLCGFFGVDAVPSQARAIVQAMAGAMHHTGDERDSFLWFGGGGMAVVTNTPDPSHHQARDTTGAYALSIAGTVTECRTVPGSRHPHGLAAGELVAAIGEQGVGLLPNLHGDFALAAYDAAQRRLTLATARYGFCPLYVATTPSGLLFASEAKAVLRAMPVRALDWQGAADFFYVGHMLGERTLFAGVQALGPGTLLEATNGELRQTRYYDFTRTPVRDRREVDLARVGECFIEGVRQRLDDVQPHTVLLSGGLDSRLILGVLHQLGAHPRLVTLEHRGIQQGADGRYAQAIARQLGLECELRATQEGFYAGPQAREVFYILDGMTPTWELFIGQIYPELEPGLGTVWDGLALDVALGGSHQVAAAVSPNLAVLLENRSLHRRLLRRILAPEAFAALDTSFLPRLRAEIELIPDNQNRYANFLLKHRTRRRIAPNPHQLYSAKVQPRTPGADERFLHEVLGIPADMRLDHRLYLDLIQAHFPHLLAVPLSSGGVSVRHASGLRARLDASLGRARAEIIRASRRYSLSKRVRRITSKPLKSRDGELAQQIADQLDGCAFDRPFYNTDELRRSYARYQRGDIMQHELFTLVLYLELWHRMFLDDPSKLRS